MKITIDLTDDEILFLLDTVEKSLKNKKAQQKIYLINEKISQAAFNNN